ncbi:MAG: hypothetical protein JXC85_02630 [Candidatus Aenigmarchaeota archaeon]|nr:hypothetical protein [Candidatus Aenigmarchaeota archaeon]
MTRNVSVVLPVISLAILSLFWLRPGITGFAVGAGSVIDADVKVTIGEGVIIPVNSTVEVVLGGGSSTMPFSRFVESSGAPFEIVSGEVPEIGYRGPGYAGNHMYMIPVSHFNLSREVGAGTHLIKVRLLFDDALLSEGEEEVIV